MEFAINLQFLMPVTPLTRHFLSNNSTPLILSTTVPLNRDNEFYKQWVLHIIYRVMIAT